MKEHDDKDFPWIKNEQNQIVEKDLLKLQKALEIGSYQSTPQPDASVEHCSADEKPPEQPKAIRHDQGKPHMDLLSPIAMFGTAAVLTKGLEKYKDSQWKQGMPWSKVLASLLRHTFKFMAGEDYDYDDACKACHAKDCQNHTGLPHVDCMAVNVMFLQEYFRRHKKLDDRMKTGLE